MVATGIDAEDVRRPQPTTVSVAPIKATEQAAKSATPSFGQHGAAAAVASAADAAIANGHDGYQGGASIDEIPAERFAATGSAQQPELSNQPAGNNTGSIELGQTVLKPKPVSRPAQHFTPAEKPKENGDMAFIPPRPARPSDAEQNHSPDVFEAADAQNATPPRFGLRTLFGKNKGGHEDHSEQSHHAAPRQAHPQPQAPAPRQTEMSLGENANQSLKADPASRVKTSNASDDLLEIPAFLRRQAN